MSVTQVFALAVAGVLAVIWGATLWLLREDIKPPPPPAPVARAEDSARRPSVAPVPPRAATATTVPMVASPVPVPQVADAPAAAKANDLSTQPTAPERGTALIPPRAAAPPPPMAGPARPRASVPPPPQGQTPGGFVAMDPFAEGGPAPVTVAPPPRAPVRAPAPVAEEDLPVNPPESN